MSSPFTRPPPLQEDPLYVCFVRDQTARLKDERPDWKYEQRADEARQRWLNPEAFPHSPYQHQAEERYKVHQSLVQDFELRKALPCTTQLLSSLRRPLPLLHRCRPVNCLTFSDTPLLHRVLSFVADVELFFLFARLSTFHRWVFTAPELHRLYGQQRFALSDCQWRLFSAASFPQLTVPVHKLAYYGYHMPFGLDRFNDTKDKVPCESNSGRDKDWALESLNLMHHLHFATLYITRMAPTHTSACRPLQYRLPRLVRALLIDQLSCRAVTPLIRARMYPINSRLLYLDYAASFNARSSQNESVVLTFAAGSCSPSTSFTASSSATGGGTTATPHRCDRALETATWQPGAAELELKGQAMRDELVKLYMLPTQCGKEPEPLDELIHLGGGYTRAGHALACLWFGRALRDAASRDRALVDLEHCPLIGYHDSFHSPPMVLAADVEAWLTQMASDGRTWPEGHAKENELLREWIGDKRDPVCVYASPSTRRLEFIEAEWLTYVRGLVQRARTTASCS